MIFKKWFSHENRVIKSLEETVKKINDFEPQIKALSDNTLKVKTATFKEKLQKGETLDVLLPEVFATVREAAFRTLKQRHFDVQLLGGIVLHQRNIAEMRTGEGKTDRKSVV